MAIYTGVVTAMGSGDVKANNTSTYVQREFVDIGSSHLRKVFSHQYVDDMLQSAHNSGESIALSTYKWLGLSRHNVCAIRMANGSVRTAESLSSMLLVVLAFAPIMGGLVAIAVALALSFVMTGDAAFTVGLISGVAYAILGAVNYLRARFAL